MPTEVEEEIQLHSTDFVEIHIMIEELAGITNKAK
jgi:hypothetical protein